jgi:hypothetical protein
MSIPSQDQVILTLICVGLVVTGNELWRRRLPAALLLFLLAAKIRARGDL